MLMAEKLVIQQKHFLFRWRVVDGWINENIGASCNDFHLIALKRL